MHVNVKVSSGEKKKLVEMIRKAVHCLKMSAKRTAKAIREAVQRAAEWPGMLKDRRDAEARQVVARLEDSDRDVRRDAMLALRRLLEPAMLAQHANAVVARLEDSDWVVRLEALRTLGMLEPAALAQHADAVVAKLEDSDEHVRREALVTLGMLEPAALAKHARDVVATLAMSYLTSDGRSWIQSEARDFLCKLDSSLFLELLFGGYGEDVCELAFSALRFKDQATLAQHAEDVIHFLEHADARRKIVVLDSLMVLEPATLAQLADAVGAKLEDFDLDVRISALHALRNLEPATLSQYAGAVSARLEDHSDVRYEGLVTLRFLEPATLAQHADAVVATLDDASEYVRKAALGTLGMLEPAALAQHAEAVVARLEDSIWQVRREALIALGKLDPPSLAQHAGAVVTRLFEDSYEEVLRHALATLGKLDPATLAQHAAAVIAMLDYASEYVRDAVSATVNALPLVVTRDVDLNSSDARSRLLGRLAWYKYRLLVRVKRIALYWYALPYRPSGPGHARDVEAWGQILVEE